MGVRGAGHVEVGAHHRDEAGVVPVGGLVNVRLFPPDLGGGVGQVAVPVVEAHGHAAQQGEEAASGGVGDLAHGRDGGKADDPVRPVALHRGNHGSGDELQDLVPAHPPEASLSAGLLVALALMRIALDGLPGSHGVGVLFFGLPPEVQKGPLGVGVLHPDGAIEVPAEADAPLATPGLIRGQARLEARVIRGLKLPGDHPVLDEDLPGARTRAVHPVGGAHPLVVLEPVAVELLPLPFRWTFYFPDPILHAYLLSWLWMRSARLLGLSCQRMAW